MRLLVLAVVLAAPASSTRAETIAIEHAPLDCVPADRYVRIAARAPQAAVTSAELQFRSEAEGPWYSARMAAEGGEWAAFLPRPARTLGRLEYRIVMTGAGAEGATAPVAPRVATADGACATAGQVSVDTPIVVTVPPGAPVVPPVPAGFSPAGVVAAEEGPRSNLALKIAGGVVVAGVAAAALGGAAASTSGPRSTEVSVPPIFFNTTDPRPGSTLSPNRDRLVIFMRMRTQPSVSLNLIWRVELLSDAAGAACLVMNGLVRDLRENIDFTLTSALVSTGACGPPDRSFDVDRVRVAITALDRPVFDETLGFGFHIEP